MVTIDQAKQLDYAQTRRECHAEIALEMEIKRKEGAKEKKEYQAEQMPKEGFNGA